MGLMGKAEREARKRRIQGHIERGLAHLEASKAKRESTERHLQAAMRAIERLKAQTR